MAREYSMGYFTDGNGAITGVEYSADLAKLQQTVDNQNENLLDFMDDVSDRFDHFEDNLLGLLSENQMIMKELCRQLDVLTELVGEMSAKLDRGNEA